MIVSRDSFDALEAQLRDRYRFIQWSLASFGVAATLLLEKGLEFYLEKNTDHAITVMLFSIPFVLFGS